MNEIISKIKDLYEALVKANAKADAIGGHQIAEAARLEGKEASLGKKAVELSLREEAVKKSEGLVAMNMSISSLTKKAEDITNEIAKERKTFLEWVSKEKAEITKSYKDIEASLTEVKRREDALKADREKLEKEKLSYKNDIIKSFDRK